MSPIISRSRRNVHRVDKEPTLVWLPVIEDGSLGMCKIQSPSRRYGGTIAGSKDLGHVEPAQAVANHRLAPTSSGPGPSAPA